MKNFLFTLILIICAFPAIASDEPNNVVLDVFSSRSAVQPGETFTIALQQSIRDGWHTYWLNPGDSGEAMTIQWASAEDFQFSDISYPTPDRIPYDPLVNFGHTGQPVFTQKISVDPNFDNEFLVLNGQAFWLVCDEICIPESQDISLTVPVQKNGQDIHQDIFDTAKATSPIIVDWPSSVYKTDHNLNLNVSVPKTLHGQMTDVEVFPYDWGLIQTDSQTIPNIEEDQIIFIQKAGERNINQLETAQFIIKTSNSAYQINAEVTNFLSNPSKNIGLFYILLFAFIGGLILNLMPCVFPVLSLKALSLIELSEEHRKKTQLSGFAYTLGVVLSFIAIASLLIILKNSGSFIGWGFQLQNPFIITGLIVLFFIIGLNLLGLFDISGRFSNLGSHLTKGNNLKSSFFTGVLATIVATPCTAPFMATAIGYALIQPAAISLLVFGFLGFGLAFPYLILTLVPQIQKILPKPGPWMEVFKQLLAFPIFASVIWLIWILVKQTNDLSLIYILGLLLFIGFIIWLTIRTKSVLYPTLIAITAFLMILVFGVSSSTSDQIKSMPFSQPALQTILEQNPEQPVFVEMTAAWCITCLVNKRTSLSDSSVKALFDNLNITYMIGDWTNHNKEITAYLESHNRNGVPLYVFYGPAKEGTNKRPTPILLPQILTPSIIINTIKGDKKS